MSSNPSIDFLEMLKAGASKGQAAGSATRASNRTSTTNSQDKVSQHSTTRSTQKSKTVEKATPEVKEKLQNKNCKGLSPKTSKSAIASRFAVIDTETNWRDQVMSIGVAIADATTFKCIDCLYYIVDPEYRSGGMYSGVLHYHVKRNICEAPLNYRESGKPSSEELLLSTEEHVVSRKEALQAIKSYLQELGISSIYAYNGKFDLGHLPELGSFEWYDIMRLAAYKQYNRAIDDSLPCCKTGRLKSNYGVEPITRMLSGDMRYCEVHNAVYDAVDELRIIELLGRSLEEYEVAKIN